MKRILIAASAAALFLTGCTSSTVDDQGRVVSSDSAMKPDVRVFETVLPDGNTTVCVFAKQGYGGGLDCDFDGPR